MRPSPVPPTAGKIPGPMDTDLRAEAPLPTLTKLGNPSIPEDIDASRVAIEWLASFADFAQQADADGILGIMVKSTFAANIFKPAGSDLPSSTDELSVYWRDVLALTWDFRTFEGTANIGQFLSSRLAGANLRNVRLQADSLPPQVQKPFPDLVWIQLFFSFETNVGLCSGIARLVPICDKNQETVWKAHTIFTNLDNLKAFPEQFGPLRNHEPNHGKWETARKQEVAFEAKDPTVLIVGGGQSGLDVAARLKALGVTNLVIEKNARVGDNWRTRYEALCLHDPVWYDHMPYMPFPPSWPVYTPAKKLANWLEYYAEAMELNVWTASTVVKATHDPASKRWSVVVKKKDGSERVFDVAHVVLATGFKGGKGYVPTLPGMESFKGQILHSTQHDKAIDHLGKKVVLIGSCTSAHDIGVDYADHNIDVTMFQRSSTYVLSTKKGAPLLFGGVYWENGPTTEIADKINASFPNIFNSGMTYRGRKLLDEADKEMLDGLHKRGFRTNNGYKECGVLLAVWDKAGGYYLDVGGSQYIIDGRIKLKNDSQIERFTETGLKFENGSELPADVVIFCTGMADPRDTQRQILGDELAAKAKPVWGLNEEGEINGCWGDSGIEGMWNMMGNLGLCRFYSKHIALQIKAIEEGIFGDRYSV